MAFLIIQCNKCGKWSVGETNNIASYTFRCKYGDHSRKLKSPNQPGLNLNFKGPFSDGRKAGELCKIMNGGGIECLKN